MALEIGVITLSHNQGDYLLDAINSILTQEPAKYLVYDCGSTDYSREIINSIQDAHVQKMFVDSDNGPAEGLNMALENLEEDIFYYLNADDRLLPGAFAFAKEYFNTNPTCDILHGSINLIDHAGKITKKLPSMRFSLWRYAIKACVVYQQATFIRRELLPSKAFNEENRISWDGELIVDLVIAGAEIHRTNYLLGEFRMHPTSISSARTYRRKIEKEHSRISRKILSSDLKAWEKAAGIAISKVEAISRRIFRSARDIPIIYYHPNF